MPTDDIAASQLRALRRDHHQHICYCRTLWSHQGPCGLKSNAACPVCLDRIQRMRKEVKPHA